MSLKAEIETWVEALASYDNNEFDEALKVFENIADTSKILFNCGVIHATLGEHEKAVDCYQRAVGMDQYLAVAYFQQGVSNFLMGDFEEALANFNDTLLYLRGNNNIDYEQLGLKFKLYSCEVLFNRGLCYIYLQQVDAGMQDLDFAAKEKVVPDHDVIEEAIREQAEGYTVFSIPVGIVYRPNEAKVKNLKAKDYLGKARLVAAADRSNAFTGFSGAEIKKMNEVGTNAKDDRPDDKISYAATNLVKPNLASRGRQQSEPPLNRNMFPHSPPENDKSSSSQVSDGTMSRAQSVRGGGPKPTPRALELGSAAFDQGERPRPGTLRSASERPRPTRDYSTRRQRDMPRRRMIEEEEEDDYYPDDFYDMYNKRPSYGNNGPMRSRSRRPTQPAYIEEEEEEDDYSDDLDDPEFEMVRPAPSQRSRRGAPSVVSSSSGGSRRMGGGGGGGMSKIRVKVHHDDTRYVLVDPNRGFREFVAQIRDKFGLRLNFKIMIKDDGDMITMSDEDDLEMAMRQASSQAKRSGSDMPKMEVWIQEV